MRGQKAVPGRALALWPEPVASGLADPGAVPSAGPGADRTDVHRRLDSWARMLAAYLRVQAEMESSDERCC